MNQKYIFAAKAAAQIRELFLPADCALCGERLYSGEEAYFGLCHDCAASFPIEDVPRCAQCGKPLISESGICMSCRKATPAEGNETAEGASKDGASKDAPLAPAFDRALVLYPYIGRYRELLKAYKFGKRKNLARYFAQKMLDARKFIGDTEEFVWTPVPPRAGKIKEALWDQVEEIAKELERGDLRIERCLTRLASQSQKKLDRTNRLTNLKGKIQCENAKKNVILFDDVFTTGATLSVCAAALKAAGAEKVFGLCLFYD